MRKNFIFLLVGVLSLVFLFTPNTALKTNASIISTENHKSSVLIEKNSKTILSDNNAHLRLPIASVTKLMTVLLTLEKLENNEINLEDKIVVSANASGMGGSQIFLDANCEYRLGDLLKSVIISSANDSSVALAEHIAGSENNFVRMMNERAYELDLKDTNYSNCTGLPTNDGYSSAYDQAIILSKVLDFDLYHKYSSIWMEDFVHPSGRITGMTNTNKLSRFYEGCVGGKTGSTNQAKYCLAVGAKRNDTNLISVVLGAENSQTRFKLASDLLNYGFENFTSKSLLNNETVKDLTVKIKGQDRTTHVKCEREYTHICKRNENINYSINYNLPDKLTEVTENQIIGTAEIVIDGIIVDTINLLSTETHKASTFIDNFKEIINN